MRPHLLDVVQRGDDGAPLLVPAFDQDDEVGYGLGVDRPERLVEQDKPRILQEETREQHALELTAGQGADHAIGKVEQAERGERPGHRPLALCVDAAPDADLAPQPHGNAVEHRHGEAAVDVDLLRQIGDLVPVEPMQVDRAIEGSKLTHDALEQSRLAGAVGPDKREQLALFHLAGDMVHGRMAIIAKREIVEADGNARAHASTQAMQSQSRSTATPPMARRAGTARRNSEKPKTQLR